MGDEQTDSFDVVERADGDRAWIALHGELDLATVDEVRARLDALRAEGRPVVLDLDQLTFMDSTGIRLVLEAVRHRERDGWRFEVTRGSTAVQRIFAAARIDDRLPYASKDD
ncbi:MAG TPA: STAS domain-containing protein [Solirubrobacteraceae bacterium]|jgi:anti-sigma B factor antagonist|nr:STAS domain-containing protein [Solirubrobacteraceae bacterium]